MRLPRSKGSRSPLFCLVIVTSVGLLLPIACGNKGDAKSPEASPTVTGTMISPSAPCNDAPQSPGDVMAKEPTVFQTCLAGAKPDPNLCGSAKIAVTIGKDGKVSSAQVAQSTLPAGVTECIKARLSSMQFACPKEGSASYTLPVGFGSPTGTGGCPGIPGSGSPTP